MATRRSRSRRALYVLWIASAHARNDGYGSSLSRHAVDGELGAEYEDWQCA
jgi:hypothetical protein